MISEATVESTQPVNDQQNESPLTKTATTVATQPHDAVQAAAAKIQYHQQPAQQLPVVNTQDSETLPESSQIDEQKTERNNQVSVNDGATPKKKPMKAHEKEMLKQFHSETLRIVTLGTRLQKEAERLAAEARKKLDNRRTLPALAEVLRVYETFFDSATPEQQTRYKDHLIHQGKSYGYKKKDHRTTEFHLLSRMLRQSDRQQASADAIILIKARKAGQTSSTFVEWAKENGGYEGVRNNKDLAGGESDDGSNQTDSGTEAKPKRKTAPFKKYRCLASIDDANAPAALRALPTNVVFEVTICRYSDRIDIMIYEAEKGEDKKTVEPASSTTEQHEVIQSSVGHPTLEENNKVVAEV